MSRTYSNLLYHIVWSTKDRKPFIKEGYQLRLYHYIREVIENEGASLLFINGTEDHVHLLLSIPLTILIPDLVVKVKPVSTKWFRETFPVCRDFSWQQGYGVFTVGKSNLQSVIKYIENQKEHHKKMSFEEEFIKMLEMQGISYNPKYLLG